MTEGEKQEGDTEIGGAAPTPRASDRDANHVIITFTTGCYLRRRCLIRFKFLYGKDMDELDFMVFVSLTCLHNTRRTKINA